MAEEIQNPEVAEEVPAEVVAEAVAEVKADPAVADPVAELAELVSVRCRRYRLYNPYSKVSFPFNRRVDGVTLDGWLQSQLDAGYIERV